MLRHKFHYFYNRNLPTCLITLCHFLKFLHGLPLKKRKSVKAQRQRDKQTMPAPFYTGSPEFKKMFKKSRYIETHTDTKTKPDIFAQAVSEFET